MIVMYAIKKFAENKMMVHQFQQLMIFTHINIILIMKRVSYISVTKFELLNYHYSISFMFLRVKCFRDFFGGTPLKYCMSI